MDFWQHVDATPAERQRVSSLEALLRLPAELAAPRNRQREVRCIKLGTQCYYLKVFERTQTKNQLRFAVTRPRCRTDAERELGVALALRDRGIRVARPIGIGRRGPTSFYLCAALPGPSLRERLAAGRWTRDLARRVAAFAGGIATRGVVLPDLSADHVFVLDGADPAGEFAVIDLHNGRLARRASIRDATRMLRRFAKSIRGLPVSRRQALEFSVRLLRAMGLGDRSRRILARLPTLDTHTRYDAPGKSTAYRARRHSRHRAEMACLQRIWPGREGDRILDVPCGAGRLHAVLADWGATIIGADRSREMLRQAAVAPGARPVPLLRAEATALPLADGAVDGAVAFRFLHHLPAADAERVVAELTRVAARYVVVSFFHPVSAHGLTRRVHCAITGRAAARHTVTPATLRRWFAARGFAPAGWSAQRAYLREFWLAAFVRV
ncbi:MAG: methyltransferase domain-containing protein [Planctomycetota bacterium]